MFSIGYKCLTITLFAFVSSKKIDLKAPVEPKRT